jgi:hypothetical protein
MKQTKEEIKHDIKVRRSLADLATDRLPLGEFITKARLLDDEVSAALDGIFCGSEGRMRELLPKRHRYLVLTWYDKKVEVAYIS